MKTDRQQLIESLATGNIHDILKNSEYKFIFTVFIKNNPKGLSNYTIDVRTLDSSTDRYTLETRTGIGNYEDSLTPDEKKYMELCDKIGRYCCIICVTPQKFET